MLARLRVCNMGHKSDGPRRIVISAAFLKAEIPNLEDHNMNRTHGFIATLFLTAALAAPVSMMAAPKPQVGVQVRIYDKAHKDYHPYDDNERQVYTQFRTTHKTYNEDLTKETPKHQAAYFSYRHAHPDNKSENRNDKR
jgi:hypothetical protein